MKLFQRSSRVAWLLVVVWLAGFVVGLFAPNVPVAAAQRQRPGATFPMGADITTLMPQLAEPDGHKVADELVVLGASWVRFEFKATDPTNLQWQERAIKQLQSRGLRILAVLVDPFATCHSDSRERDPAVFAQWVRRVYLAGCGEDGPTSVHQLGFDELTLRFPFIQHWQLWNEPNVCGFLKSDPDNCGYGLWRRDIAGGERVGGRIGMQKFGALLATVYAERTNKSVKIVTGGILNAYNCSIEADPTCNPGPADCYKLLPWDKFGCDAGTNLLINSAAVQRFKAENNRFPFDILGLHPYQQFAWANGYVPPAQYVAQDIAKNVRRFVDSSYPIWITEWGFDLASPLNQPCRYPTPAVNQQGCEENVAALMESLVLGLNARPDLNVGNFFWFNLADPDERLQTGLLDHTNRKRPAWFSFQEMVERGGQTNRQIVREESLRALVQLVIKVFTRK